MRPRERKHQAGGGVFARRVAIQVVGTPMTETMRFSSASRKAVAASNLWRRQSVPPSQQRLIMPEDRPMM